MSKKIATLLLLLSSAFVFTGFYSCGPTLPSATTGGGFFIETEFIPANLPITPQPFVTTQWTWSSDLKGFTAVGDPTTFQNTTNAAAIGVSENGRVSALWFVQWLAGGPAGCVGAPDFPGTIFQSNPQRTTEVFCIEQPLVGGTEGIGSTGDFTFSPKPIYTDGSLGSTATISGSSFSSQYGMPLLRYYDSSGNLVNQANVTSVASDGSSASGPMPNVSQVTPGFYLGLIFNTNANGSYNFLGTVSVSVLNPPSKSINPGCNQGPRPINCGT
jgi:hypothetical protein